MYSSLIEAVESVVVEDVDCCRLLCALVLLKMLNLLLKLLIVVGYYELKRALVLLKLLNLLLKLLNLLLNLLIVVG